MIAFNNVSDSKWKWNHTQGREMGVSATVQHPKKQSLQIVSNSCVVGMLHLSVVLKISES